MRAICTAARSTPKKMRARNLRPSVCDVQTIMQLRGGATARSTFRGVFVRNVQCAGLEDGVDVMMPVGKAS